MREKAGFFIGGFSIGLCIVVFYPLTRLLGRRRFEGLEHIPESGPVLVACNHVSYLDPIYAGVFMHRKGRIPRFLAKQDLFETPVIGRVMTGAGQIPVRRGSTEVGAHWGTHRVYDHYRKRFRPLPRTEVFVRAGPPVDLSDLRRRPVDGSLLREATDRVMAGVRTLLAEVRQEVAPTEFFDPLHPGGLPGRPGERPS